VPLGQASGTSKPCPSGTGRLGQSVLVPVGQAQLIPLGLGKVKRDLSLSHGTSRIPALEDFPCPGTSSIPTMELVPIPLVQLVPQGREMFAFITDTTKTDCWHILVRTHLLVLTCQHSSMFLVIIDKIYRKRSRSILIMV